MIRPLAEYGSNPDSGPDKNLAWQISKKNWKWTIFFITNRHVSLNPYKGHAYWLFKHGISKFFPSPNFDRVFMKNIILLHIFVRWPPLKNFDLVCKIKVFVVPKLKFYSELHSVAKKDLQRVSKLPSGLLTSTCINNSWRSCPTEKSVRQVWHNYCSKYIVGKLDCLTFSMRTF